MGKVPEVLSEQTAILMQSEEYKRGVWPEVEGDNLMAFGLGWDTVHGYPFGDYGIQVLFKGGDTMAFHSALVTVPEQDIAVAVTSSAGQSAFNYAAAASILEAYLLDEGIIAEISVPQPVTTPVKTEIPAGLAAYAGAYAAVGAEVNIVLDDGTMTITPVGDEPPATYIHAGAGVFQSEDGVISVKFVEAKNGAVYLQRSQGIALPEVCRLMVTAFQYQKLEPSPVAPEVLEAWAVRGGKEYFVITEGATSQQYILDPSFLSLELNSSFDSGYALAGIRITGENTAINTLTFRDAIDLAFETVDGVEYLRANDLIYVREDFIPELTGQTHSSAIGTDGFMKYFTIGPDVAGKTLTVGLPQGAAYAVYDGDGGYVNYTTVSKEHSTTLPANGKIVFIGKPGDVFQIDVG